MSMKKIEVSILGQVYVLACPEGGEALLADAVARVDREMAQIRDAGKVRARERMAVLAALNIAYLLAEQAAAPAPAARADMGADMGTDNGADPADAALVASLVSRLDAALGADGQLL